MRRKLTFLLSIHPHWMSDEEEREWGQKKECLLTTYYYTITKTAIRSAIQESIGFPIFLPLLLLFFFSLSLSQLCKNCILSTEIQIIIPVGEKATIEHTLCSYLHTPKTPAEIERVFLSNLPVSLQNVSFSRWPANSRERQREREKYKYLASLRVIQPRNKKGTYRNLTMEAA